MSSAIRLVRRGTSSSSSSSSSSPSAFAENLKHLHHPSTRNVSTTTTTAIRSRTDPGTTTSIVFIDPKRTRHWIRSFHRMTLNPHLYPSTTKSRQLHQQHSGSRHGPLFTRQSAAKGAFRPPINVGPLDASATSPKYRLSEDNEDLVHSRSLRNFDPFALLPKSERIRPLRQSTRDLGRKDLSPTFDSPSLTSLSRNSRRSSELLRTGARVDYNTESATAIEDGIFERHGQLLHNRIEASSSTFLTANHLDAEHSWTVKGPNYNRAPFQAPSVDALVERIKTQPRTFTLAEFETSLQDIGKAVLMNQGLPRAFVDSNANQQDVIGTGLDTVFQSLAPSNPTPWATSFYDLLSSFEMLHHVAPQNLHRLKSCLPSPGPQVRLTNRINSGIEDRKEVLERTIRRWSASNINLHEWRIQSRQFRMQLAVTRVSGKIPCDSDYETFMNSCLRANQYQELELAFHHYLDHVRPEGSQTSANPSEGMYRHLIQGLVRQERMDHAQEVFYGMRRNDVKPSIMIYGSLLEGFGRQLDLRKMSRVLRMMSAADLVPTLPIYTSLMANYIRAGELDRASEVRRQLLLRNDIRLDRECKNVISHLTRLQGGERLPGVKASSRLYQDTFMTWNSQSASSRRQNLRPVPLERLNQVIDINHRLKDCLDSNNTLQFAKTFQEFGSQGLLPNTVSFNILIDALVRSRNTTDALQVLTYMKTKSHEKSRPDAITYSTLIQGTVEERRANLGWSLFQEMLELSIQPTLKTYSTLFELVGKDPRNKLGLAVVKDNAAPGSRPVLRFPISAKTEETMGLNFACSLYDQLCYQGLQPNQHIFGTLLNMAASNGRMDLAELIYQEMVFKNVEPNSVIMTTLLKGFAIRRDFDSGWKIWRHMLETQMPRNVITYQHLLRLCERSLPNAQPILVRDEDMMLEPEELCPDNDVRDGTGDENEFNTIDNTIRLDETDPRPKTKGTTYKMRRRQFKKEREAAELELQKIQKMQQSKQEAVIADAQERRSIIDLFMAPTSVKPAALTPPTVEEATTKVKIPIQIWYDIREQMRLDRVDWSRVSSYNRGDVLKTVWRPVVEESGPVISMGQAIEAATAALAKVESETVEEGEEKPNSKTQEARFVSLSQSSLTVGRKIYGSKGGAAGLQASAFVLGDLEDPSNSFTTAITNSSSDSESDDRPDVCRLDGDRQKKQQAIVTTMIQESFAGGGDNYRPRRRPAKGKALVWDNETKSPMLEKVDLDQRSREKRLADLDNEKVREAQVAEQQ